MPENIEKTENENIVEKATHEEVLQMSAKRSENLIRLVLNLVCNI